MTIKYKLILSSLVVLIVLFSCSSITDVDTNNIFKYNEHKNINSLDPIYAKDIANIWAVNQIFEGLVEMDSAMNITPSIAKKWSISDDGTLYSFLIDNSVKFHPHHKIKNRKQLKLCKKENEE